MTRSFPDVDEGLHLSNDAIHTATIYLEAIAKSGDFEQERVDECLGSICRALTEANIYLIGVIHEVEIGESVRLSVIVKSENGTIR
jgi:hypothetical protein